MLRCDIDSSNSAIHRFCHSENLPWFVYALEPPGSHTAEEAIFLASAVMFVLGGLLFVLSFVSRLSGRGIFITPIVGIFLYASLSLFLPLMSYMLSQAKQGISGGELPFYAHAILVWMLLVELFRKRVDAMLAAVSSSPLRAVHQQTLWGGIDQFIRISWIGYLIYTNVHGFGRQGFIVLWALTIAKAAHRVAAVELSKSSFAIGKNPHLIVGYTAQMMAQEEEEMRDGDQAQAADGISSAALLSKCWYAVMGEDKLNWKAGRDGCSVELPLPPEMETGGKKKKKATTTKKNKKVEEEQEKKLITVGDIWEIAECGNGGRPAADRLLAAHPALKDLCLSFALFKLLRARFENLPVHEGVARKNRGFIFGCLGDGKDDEAERAFRVIELDLTLVGNYYHSASVIPAVLSSPWLLVGNCILVLLIAVNQALMGLYITGQFQVLTVIGCLARDVAKRSPMAADFFKCLCRKLLKSLVLYFSSINIAVCIVLLFTFLLMEAWEFVIYVLSDSFVVSLLCSYARRPRWQSSPCVRRAFGALLWVKRVGRAHTGVRFNQLCVLHLRRRRLHTLRVMISKLLPFPFFLGMPPVRIPKEVKHAVFASLRAKGGGEQLSNGAAVLRRRRCTQLEWACKSRSITVVILVWHIATSILDTKSSRPVEGSQEASTGEKTVARTLSRYCAHLVAGAPELLPVDLEASKLVYESVKRDVRNNKWRRSKTETVASMGDKLGTQWRNALLRRRGHCWLSCGLWTEVIVYVAPSDNIEGHATALAKGGEFITTLWAFATHAGITR